MVPPRLDRGRNLPFAYLFIWSSAQLIRPRTVAAMPRNARARLAMVAAMGSELRLAKASAAASNRPSR